MAIKVGDELLVRDYENDDQWTDAVVQSIGPKYFVANIGSVELIYRYYEHKESWIKRTDN